MLANNFINILRVGLQFVVRCAMVLNRKKLENQTNNKTTYISTSIYDCCQYFYYCFHFVFIYSLSFCAKYTEKNKKMKITIGSSFTTLFKRICIYSTHHPTTTITTAKKKHIFQPHHHQNSTTHPSRSIYLKLLLWLISTNQNLQKKKKLFIYTPIILVLLFQNPNMKIFTLVSLHFNGYYIKTIQNHKILTHPLALSKKKTFFFIVVFYLASSYTQYSKTHEFRLIKHKKKEKQ